MYLPTHFAESNVEELHRIIRENPLGMLVTHSDKGLDAKVVLSPVDDQGRARHA